jgi:hypothetical protein
VFRNVLLTGHLRRGNGASDAGTTLSRAESGLTCGDICGLGDDLGSLNEDELDVLCHSLASHCPIQAGEQR